MASFPGSLGSGAGQGPTAKDLFYKTRICKFFMAGKCKRGKYCTFAHGDGKVQSLPDFYKTRLCTDLLRTGKCAMGDQCSYAHSKADLRDSAKPVPEAVKVAEARTTKMAARSAGEDAMDTFEDQVGPGVSLAGLQPTQSMRGAEAWQTDCAMERAAQLLAALPVGDVPLGQHVQAASVTNDFPHRSEIPQRAARQQPQMSEAERLALLLLSDPKKLLNSVVRMAAVANPSASEDLSSINTATLLSNLQAIIAAQETGADNFLPSRSPEILPSRSPERFPSTDDRSFAHAGVHPSDILRSQQGLNMAQRRIAGLQPSYGAPAQGVGASSMHPNRWQVEERARPQPELSQSSVPSRQPKHQFTSGSEVPASRFQNPFPQEHGFPFEEKMSPLLNKNVESVPPAGMQVKNTFLEVNDEPSLSELSALSRFAVRTAPELPHLYPEMSEPPLSQSEEQNFHASLPFGGMEQERPVQARHRNDLGASRFPSDHARLAETTMEDERSIREVLLANQMIDTFGKSTPASRSAVPPPRPPPGIPLTSTSSGSSEMVVKNTFLDFRDVEETIHKYKIQSLPDLPWPSMAGHHPGPDEPVVDDFVQDFSPTDPHSLGASAPRIAEGFQVPSPPPPPGLTSAAPSLRSPGGIDQLLRDPHPANAPEDLEPELIGPGSSQYHGPSASLGSDDLDIRWPWPEFVRGEQAPRGLPPNARREVAEGSSTAQGQHSSDLGVIVKNTFLEAAPQDEAFASALAQHAVRTAPELPLLSSLMTL